MGRGDKKTAKGKRYASSYGNARPMAAARKATGGKTAATVKAPAAKAPARKTAAKKAAAK
jgi:30S ribosomal protein S31